MLGEQQAISSRELRGLQEGVLDTLNREVWGGQYKRLEEKQ